MEWISVKDRLPEDNTTVIIARSSGVVMTMHIECNIRDISMGNEHRSFYQKITHWMYLPEKPIK